jgi:hypothetical protein
MARAFDFAALKAQTRQTVNDFLAVDGFLYTNDEGPDGTPLSVRWHDKINRFGNNDNMGWAERVEGIDRLIFNKPELATLGLKLSRNMEIWIESASKTFALEFAEPEDGPIEEIWIGKLVDNRS